MLATHHVPFGHSGSRRRAFRFASRDPPDPAFPTGTTCSLRHTRSRLRRIATTCHARRFAASHGREIPDLPAGDRFATTGRAAASFPRGSRRTPLCGDQRSPAVSPSCASPRPRRSRGLRRSYDESRFAPFIDRPPLSANASPALRITTPQHRPHICSRTPCAVRSLHPAKSVSSSCPPDPSGTGNSLPQRDPPASIPAHHTMTAALPPLRTPCLLTRRSAPHEKAAYSARFRPLQSPAYARRCAASLAVPRPHRLVSASACPGRASASLRPSRAAHAAPSLAGYAPALSRPVLGLRPARAAPGPTLMRCAAGQPPASIQPSCRPAIRRSLRSLHTYPRSQARAPSEFALALHSSLRERRRDAHLPPGHVKAAVAPRYTVSRQPLSRVRPTSLPPASTPRGTRGHGYAIATRQESRPPRPRPHHPHRGRRPGFLDSLSPHIAAPLPRLSHILLAYGSRLSAKPPTGVRYAHLNAAA
jgi:hypothetical protein